MASVKASSSRPAGQPFFERHRKQPAQVARVQQPGHVGIEPVETKLRPGPRGRSPKAAQGKLALGVERVIEIEDDGQPAHETSASRMSRQAYTKR